MMEGFMEEENIRNISGRPLDRGNGHDRGYSR